jgi:ribosomal protein S8
MLFLSTADLRRVLPRVSANYDFEDLKPFISLAEEKYIIDFMSQDFYDELSTAYAATPSAEQLAAIRKLQFSIGYFTLLEALPHLDMQIASAGIGLGNSETTTQVPQWKQYELASSLASNGEEFLDKALTFLELKKSDYPTWLTSDAYTISKELFINSAKELNRYVPIFQSRRAYLSLRPFIKDVQEVTIAGTIGQELYDDLISKIEGDTLNLDETHLVTLIQKPLANIAARQAFNQLAIAYNGRGFRILSTSDGIMSKAVAPSETLTGLLSDFATRGESSLIALKQYLQDNADAWPLYKDSSAYVQSADTQAWKMPDNSCSNSFIV